MSHPTQRRPIVVAEQVGRVAVDRDATRLAELSLAPAAAEQPDLPGRLGVVGGIAHGDRIGLLDALQPSAGRLEDVRMGFGFLRVVGRGLSLEEILDTGDLLVTAQLLLLGGGGQRDPLAVRLDPLE
jgi:hypothetical protein